MIYYMFFGVPFISSLEKNITRRYGPNPLRWQKQNPETYNSSILGDYTYYQQDDMYTIWNTDDML